MQDLQRERELWNLQVAQHNVLGELRVYQDMEREGPIDFVKTLNSLVGRFGNNKSPVAIWRVVA